MPLGAPYPDVTAKSSRSESTSALACSATDAGLPSISNSIALPLAAGTSSQNADSSSNAAWTSAEGGVQPETSCVHDPVPRNHGGVGETRVEFEEGPENALAFGFGTGVDPVGQDCGVRAESLIGAGAADAPKELWVWRLGRSHDCAICRHEAHQDKGVDYEAVEALVPADAAAYGYAEDSGQEQEPTSAFPRRRAPRYPQT
ncbi:hypothetical protein DL770_008674 [Monosporascus sp. CRB-9-2]|nr:hypothetical protein DL770_008674 [Monosporascus sp. CRB-9-2]